MRSGTYFLEIIYVWLDGMGEQIYFVFYFLIICATLYYANVITSIHGLKIGCFLHIFAISPKVENIYFFCSCAASVLSTVISSSVLKIINKNWLHFCLN